MFTGSRKVWLQQNEQSEEQNRVKGVFFFRLGTKPEIFRQKRNLLPFFWVNPLFPRLLRGFSDFWNWPNSTPPPPQGLFQKFCIWHQKFFLSNSFLPDLNLSEPINTVFLICSLLFCNSETPCFVWARCGKKSSQKEVLRETVAK